MVAGDMSRRSLVEELVFALLQCALSRCAHQESSLPATIITEHH